MSPYHNFKGQDFLYADPFLREKIHAYKEICAECRKNSRISIPKK